MGVVSPHDNAFVEWLTNRAHVCVSEYVNASPRNPSWSVGKLEFACDRNSLYNMLYDFDPNRPMYIRGNMDTYANFFAGMLIHEKMPLLDYQEVYMELDGIGGHFDDLSACGRWLVDKKTLSKVENWTNKYLPRENHCRQLTFYRAIAHYGELLEEIRVDDKVAYHDAEPLVVGHKPKWNIKQMHIAYMPMNNVPDVRIAEPPQKWIDIPIRAAAKMLLRKKDDVTAHMDNGTLPLRRHGYECKYCNHYSECHNAGEDCIQLPDHLLGSLETMPMLGGGGE